MTFRIILLTLFINLTLQGWCINAPVPSSPANGSLMSRFTTVHTVGNVIGAINYEFLIDTTSSFSSSWVKSYTSTFRSISGPLMSIGKTYYWKVRCSDSTSTSGWSQVYSFTVGNTAPTLNRPANNSTGSITELACVNLGADSSIVYLYEVDTNTAFSSPLHRIYSSAGWLDSADIFTFGRTIYWRTTATNSIGDTFPWSVTWKYTMHNAPTLSGTSGTLITTPQHIAYWTNAGLSSIELQLDSLPSFNSGRLETHWINSGLANDTLRNLSFAKYYSYRIRAHYNNDTSDWSVTRNILIRTNGNITNPSYNGATIYALSNINFDWANLSGAWVHMELYADSNQSFLLADTILPSANWYRYEQELQLSKWYQLRVTYFHEKDTAPTLVHNFKTYGGQVNIYNPTNNATNTIVKPIIRFGSITWATAYVAEIDTGTTAPSTLSSYFQRFTQFDSNSIYRVFSPVLHYNQKYTVHIYAIKNTDTAQAATRTFTTASAPINYFPYNNSVGIGTSTNALVKSIDSSLWVQWALDTSINFNSPIYQTGTDTSMRDDFEPQYVLLNFTGDLYFNQKYYWKSRCINEVDTSEWSAVYAFTTTTDVQLYSPANGATNIPVKTWLDWSVQGSNFDQRYQYQIATDSLFDQHPVITLPIEHFSEDSITCTHATTYYWRARAFNTVDTSDWSVIYSFRTVNLPTVGNVALITPINGALIPPGTINLGWNITSNANSYDVNIAADEQFATILASGEVLGTGAQFSGAQPRTKYYWRVRGKNNFTQGAWSVRWFETGSPVGVDEVQNSTLLKVYPNPANISFTILLDKKCSIKVVDLTGKIIAETTHNGQTEIDTRLWPEGIYTVIITDDTNVLFQRISVIHNQY